MLFHFSEDSSIREFAPHVPRTNPTHPAAVWAIDEANSPLYWFPRDCPRVTVWARTDAEAAAFSATFRTTARRLHAIEEVWWERMNAVEVFRYSFDAYNFGPWAAASGQWTSSRTVVPLAVEPLGDLVGLHDSASIELRVLPSLWLLHDIVTAGDWEFSFVRMANASPRATPE